VLLPHEAKFTLLSLWAGPNTGQNLGGVTGTGWVTGLLRLVWVGPVSSEISDLLFVCYFASQNKEIKFGCYLFMCVV